MSKSDTPLKEINLEKAYSQQIKPTWTGNKTINAFDTETHEGSVFMLSYYIDEFNGIHHNRKVESLSSQQILEIITHRKCRSAINVWYNLDFDANAILSEILNMQQMKELSITNETNFEFNGIEYNLKYIKGKFLSIQDEHRNTYQHFDISQFFYTSLDNAAKEWLGESKDPIKTHKFGSNACERHNEVIDLCPYCWNGTQAKHYIQSNYEDIKKYALKDARLTYELAINLFDLAEKLDIPMGSPYSTGYLSAEYLRANTEKKPRFGSQNYPKMFWESYYGGRFEVFKRGEIGEVVAPDINSAYPAVMKDLPDPTTLNWEHYINVDVDNQVFTPDSFEFEDIEKADYGVVNAIVTTNHNEPIQPFAIKPHFSNKVHFPILTGHEITVIKPIFEFAVKNNLVEDYQLIEAWLGNETENTQYPFDFIGDLYAQRKMFEKEGFDKRAKLLKIILNSLYGKTCQTTEYKRIEEKPIDLTETPYEKIYPSDFLNNNQTSMLNDNEVIIASTHAGRRFNPFFASYITGITRLKLHKAVKKYDLVDATVMFATDSIMVEKEPYENSNFNELIQTTNFDLEGEKFKESAIDSLGKWDFDYEGKAFVVGSGVYEVTLPNGNNYLKTRGFREKDLDGTLRELGEKYKTHIPVENERPLTISEVVISPDKGNVSQFIKETKEISPDFDDKRNWEKLTPTFTDLLEGTENSMPITLSDEQSELLKEVQTNV
ncbi:DNA polymerase [Methanohalobium sp.]|uniref:DNA polymerase n=1 Tax=Methanohalobium sp. TaxID=2837493 RepID=UPI0025CDDF79|nr:DNA polymerase [Methanohalobium sp.]